MAEWTLRHAEYFLAVVNHGSVSAAAQAVHISQGAVSMAMAQLESALGVQLLTRGKAQRSTPTAAGLEFAGRVRDILDLVEDATVAASGADHLLRGRITFGITISLSPRVLPVLLDTFRNRWPAVETSIAELSPEELQLQVLNDVLDVGFLYRQQINRPVEQHVIAPVQLHAVLPADHTLAERDSLTLADLAAIPVILPDAPPTPQILVALMAREGYEPNVLWESKNAETIRALVGRGLGFSLVNAVPDTGQTFDGASVRFVPIDGLESRNMIVAITNPHRRVSRKVLEAMEVLREALRG